MSGMKFECFYYPVVNEEGKVVKTIRNVKLFNYGDEVPTKTLYYNYGKNFAIYQGSRIIAVEDGILKGEITKDELKFPLKLVFDKGTQLTIFSKDELSSVRLLLSGENEIEKELGNLFFLSRVYNRKIKNIQYEVMAELTNCYRDVNYINDTIEERTKNLIKELQIVERNFRDLVIKYPDIKEKYLSYMNFGDKEDMFDLSINKYCVEGSEQYEYYKVESVVLKAKPIYPKFKLDHFMSSMDYN